MKNRDIPPGAEETAVAVLGCMAFAWASSFYGLLLAHRAVRTLMLKAARKAELDPDRLSFTHAVRVVRRKLAERPAFPP